MQQLRAAEAPSTADLEPGKIAITGEPNKTTLDRSWITQRAIAQALAKSAGRANALPDLSGSARLRRHGSLYDDLAPGSMFTFNLSTRTLTNYVFRVLDRNLANSAKPEFDITFRVDRSYLYQPPA